MNITDLQRGERGVVLNVACAAPLKERLRSLNVRTGGVIRVLKVSWLKRTYLLQAGGSKLAIRREVARCVTIRRV